MPVFGGLDPGIDGCLALLLGEGTVEFYDLPFLTITGGAKAKRVPDEVMIAALFKGLMDRFPDDLHIGVEKQQAFPAQDHSNRCPACGQGRVIRGVVASTSFLEGYGLLRGILAALDIPREFIPPQTWKKVLMPGTGHDKDASRQVAMRHFPSAIPSLKLVKNHNRADAALIGLYTKRTHF